MFGAVTNVTNTPNAVNSPPALVCTVNVNSARTNATIRPPFMPRYRSLKGKVYVLQSLVIYLLASKREPKLLYADAGNALVLRTP